MFKSLVLVLLVLSSGFAVPAAYSSHEACQTGYIETVDLETGFVKCVVVSINQIIRKISTKTPARSNFLPPAIFKKYGTKNELSITPIAGVVAKLPIKKLLAPRCSRSSDNKGL